MEEFASIEILAEKVKSKLDGMTGQKKVLALYAFNATGKTRLAKAVSEFGSGTEDGAGDEAAGSVITSISYDAFLEDIFIWDNETKHLKFDPRNWIIKFVEDQGLDGRIAESFQEITRSKIDPVFDFTEGFVHFNNASGDEKSEEDIKISKGEESTFIWSIFYIVLEAALGALNDDKENRTTHVFDDLRYVIIDDPVSSLDDTKIIAIAEKLSEIIKKFKDGEIKFLITTHHALFFNVVFNALRGGVMEAHTFSQKSGVFYIKRQKDDSPFSYHLAVKELIEDALKNDGLEKYHFNLLRNMLEKTANFLGYNNYSDCIFEGNKSEFMRLINLYSHSKIADVDPRELSERDKEIFRDTFSVFVREFKWKESAYAED